jgi:transposase
MLRVEERFMIKDLHEQETSISEIARQTGFTRAADNHFAPAKHGIGDAVRPAGLGGYP